MELDSENYAILPQDMRDHFSDIFEELPNFKHYLKLFHPVKSAISVSGILTIPSSHANTIRLELLIHLLLAYGSGKRKINAQQLKTCLNQKLGATMFAHLEDPIEDVFISNVCTNEGNIRIFEGIWESSDFYLQRILNILQTLPDKPSTRRLRREVYALLNLSEKIALRCELDRFLTGGGQAKGTINIPWKFLESFQSAITFSQDNLEQLGILPVDLDPFIFNMNFRSNLGNHVFGDSDLDRHPIVHYSGKWFVLLPTAISATVRRHVIEWMLHNGYQTSFDQHMVLEYKNLFRETPILGSLLPEKIIIPSDQIAGKKVFEVSTEFDTGRYLQIIAVIDSIKGYQSNGLLSPDANYTDFSDQINRRIEHARSYFRRQKGFKQGLTLVVGCGYGRPGIFNQPTETTDWWVRFVSAPDLQTLAWDPELSPFVLWKLVSHERFLADHDISITNANGLLNLFGWWKETNFFMLPSEIKFASNPISITIPTNCLSTIREKVRKGWDVHVLPHPSGKFVRVRRISADNYFQGEADKPLYSSIEAICSGNLLGVWIGKETVWWIKAKSGATQLSRDLIFRVWDAVNNWLERAVPVLEQIFRDKANPILTIVLDFNEAHQEQAKPDSENVLRSCLSVKTDREIGTIQIGFHDPFFGGFRLPVNIAERAIIRALIQGVHELADVTYTDDTLDRFVNKIVPDEYARYVHFFEAVHFRDYIRNYDHPEKLFIEEADESKSKLGLGWLVQSSEAGDRFTSPDKSVTFLNSVVAAIFKRMQSSLDKLDRKEIIEQAFRHIEGVEAEKQKWNRTYRAVVALRKDEASCKSVAIRQVTRCNASELALRLVAEIALSECPLTGGEPVGNLDLTPLMADALLMFHLGGLSDAINKGVMEPEVQIQPSGDVLTHVGFRDEIVDPLGKHFGSVKLDYEASRYNDHFKPFQPTPTVKGQLPDEFLAAFEAEFGLSFDALRGVCEALENLSLDKKECVFTARQTEIFNYCGSRDYTNSEAAKIVFNRFRLWPRKSLDTTPDGFKKKDWYPWRFGRRLSLVARPLIQLEHKENPRFIVSPGLLGQGIAYTITRYYEAQIESRDCRSKKMRSWINKEKKRRSHAFVCQVFKKIKALGYEARMEVKVSAILNEQLDMDYGDVDILAWKSGGNDTLVIECKNLKFAKTPNEIAEQLNRFSGQTLAGGKRDDLLKHLDRCNLLRAKAKRLAKTIGLGERDIRIQSVVCFSKPVPMQYVTKRFQDVSFQTIDDLN